MLNTRVSRGSYTQKPIFHYFYYLCYHMLYGYARVSTKTQEKDGNSLEAQTIALTKAGAEVVYHDSFTGTKVDRPEFSKLIEKLESGDTLLVTKIDRFARSVVEGYKLINELIERGVTVNILNTGVMDNSPMGKYSRTMMLAFAEFERDMIVQRTQEGKEIARARGVRVDGRPEKKVDPELYQECLTKQKNGQMSVKQCCETLGISRSKWYKMIESCYNSEGD